jgi:ABC-2 type transport system permease protein
MRVPSLRNVWLIAHREYTERIRTRGFMITTVMIPLIMAGFIVGSLFLGSKAVSDIHIAVVSSDTQLALDLQAELQAEQQQQDISAETDPAPPTRSKKQPHILVDAMDAAPDTKAILDQEFDSQDLDGYLWITPAATPGGRPTFAYTPRASGERSVRDTLAAALDKVLLREQLTHRGIVAADAETMMQPVEITAPKTVPHEDHASAEISISVLFFVMYLVIMLYGMNVARSIIEEKSSRIFEVMLATIRPEAMMAGKILGVGAVGLTQVGIWVAAVALIAASPLAMHLGGGDALHVSLTAPQIFFFFVYFILGYLFYSSIAAALGAMTNSEQELQQLNMFLMIPLLLCFLMVGTMLTAPDSPIARILALVPPFTPLLMYFRVSLGHPAVWEIVLSIVLTSGSICGIIWVTSRIYRVGVLMYGKRPSLPEILHWLKYS